MRSHLMYFRAKKKRFSHSEWSLTALLDYEILKLAHREARKWIKMKRVVKDPQSSISTLLKSERQDNTARSNSHKPVAASPIKDIVLVRIRTY